MNRRLRALRDWWVEWRRVRREARREYDERMSRIDDELTREEESRGERWGGPRP